MKKSRCRNDVCLLLMFEFRFVCVTSPEKEWERERNWRSSVIRLGFFSSSDLCQFPKHWWRSTILILKWTIKSIAIETKERKYFPSDWIVCVCYVKVNQEEEKELIDFFFLSFSLERDKRKEMKQFVWWWTSGSSQLTMPCGLIVSIRLFFFVIIYLVHSSWSRSILFDRNQRDSIISIEKNFTKERRHSIFDDKNGAILGELVRFLFFFFIISLWFFFVQHTFLSNYGYLPRSDLETRAMRTDEEFRSAIRRLQTFASIPVTVRWLNRFSLFSIEFHLVFSLIEGKIGQRNTRTNSTSSMWSRWLRTKSIPSSSSYWKSSTTLCFTRTKMGENIFNVQVSWNSTREKSTF